MELGGATPGGHFDDLLKSGGKRKCSTPASGTPSKRLLLGGAIKLQGNGTTAAAGSASDVLWPLSVPSSTPSHRARQHTFTSSPKSAATPKRRRRFKIDDKQLFLNFGQKNIGHTTCKECGMTYSPGLEEDQHRVYHENTDKLSFTGWKSETVLSTYADGRCIMVLPSTSPRQWKKVQGVISVVDEELGFCEEVPISPLSKVLLYISNRKVIGCLVAQPVEKACPLLPPTPDDSDVNLDSTGLSADTSVADLSTSYCNKVGGDATSVVCGVSRIWVTSSSRRKGVATRMLDCLRKHFFHGISNQSVEKQQVAFTTPTESGQAFAKSYMDGDSVLVYS